jgi:hypothetical protein
MSGTEAGRERLRDIECGWPYGNLALLRDLLRESYATGVKDGLEQAAKVADNAIGARRGEIAAAIRALGKV